MKIPTWVHFCAAKGLYEWHGTTIEKIVRARVGRKIEATSMISLSA
jgi:hypothetical protein